MRTLGAMGLAKGEAPNAADEVLVLPNGGWMNDAGNAAATGLAIDPPKTGNLGAMGALLDDAAPKAAVAAVNGDGGALEECDPNNAAVPKGKVGADDVAGAATANVAGAAAGLAPNTPAAAGSTPAVAEACWAWGRLSWSRSIWAVERRVEGRMLLAAHFSSTTEHISDGNAGVRMMLCGGVASSTRTELQTGT